MTASWTTSGMDIRLFLVPFFRPPVFGVPFGGRLHGQSFIYPPHHKNQRCFSSFLSLCRAFGQFLFFFYFRFAEVPRNSGPILSHAADSSANIIAAPSFLAAWAKVGSCPLFPERRRDQDPRHRGSPSRWPSQETSLGRNGSAYLETDAAEADLRRRRDALGRDEALHRPVRPPRGEAATRSLGVRRRKREIAPSSASRASVLRMFRASRKISTQDNSST
jgi:hypothetical protein